MPLTCLDRPGIEGEIAFRMARPLYAADGPCSAEAIHAAIGSVHVAIELVDSRYADWRQASPVQLLADGLISGALILGDPLPAWECLDLTTPGLSIQVDGALAADAGRNSADPLHLLRMMVDHCCQRGIDVLPGAVLTTGSSTGLIFVDRESTVELIRDGRAMAQLGGPTSSGHARADQKT